MKNIIGVLLILLAGGLFVSCGTVENGNESVVQELTTGLVQGCEQIQGPAVSLMAEDNVSHLPLTGLKLRYRVNGGDWKPEVVVNELPYTIVGPAGEYEIEIHKDAFPLRMVTILVPQEESCGIVRKDLTLYLERPSCPLIPPVIQIFVTTQPVRQSNLNIILTSAEGYETPVTCTTPGPCHFNMELIMAGKYMIKISGFEDYRKLFLVEGIVHYAYTDVTIEMHDGGNQYRTIASEGINNITLTIPYSLGDSGCNELNLSGVEVRREHVLTSDLDVIETMENLSFTIEPISSARCPGDIATRNMVTMDYEVLLPAGTRIADVKIEYWAEEGWKAAVCRDAEGYMCSATYPNPFFGEKYQVRAVIQDRVLVGSNFSLSNKCLVFGEPIN